jgi:hypothetical protein
MLQQHCLVVAVALLSGSEAINMVGKTTTMMMKMKKSKK